MNEIDTPRGASAPSTISRRSVVASAAWAVPAVAAAVTIPAASASVSNAEVAWTASQTGLLSLRLLDGASLITAQALVTVPTQLTVLNGAGAISGETGTVQITVGRPVGINIPVGRARGFGVYAYNGTPTPSGSRSAVYQSGPIIGQYGFPSTTYTTTQTISVASNGSLNIPVVFGLAGASTGVSISLLSSFPVTATISVAGRVLSASSVITVPVGAGIL